MIAHPPCTFLTNSSVWALKDPDFERYPGVGYENPAGMLSSLWRKPDQKIQPWQFGEDASKGTCLWLKGLPALVETDNVKRPAGERYANQTAGGQNKLSPSGDREAAK